MGLPKSLGREVIMVVVDRLSKYAHFVGLHHPFSASTMGLAFLNNIFKLHGMPLTIVSDRDFILLSSYISLSFKESNCTYLRHTTHKRMCKPKW